MSASSIPLQLLALWRRRAGEPDPCEPADLGTAFGLELSMLPEDDDSSARTEARTGVAWWRRFVQPAAD